MPGQTMTRTNGGDTKGSNGNRQALLPFPSSHERRWGLYARQASPPPRPTAIPTRIGRQTQVTVSEARLSCGHRGPMIRV